MTSLSLYEDLLGPGEILRLPRGSRVLYVASGTLAGLHAGDAHGSADDLELEAGPDGATVLRWELTDWGVEDAKLTVPIELDPWGDYVLRCERGASAQHGIACLLRGELRVDGRGVAPFEAWATPAQADGRGEIVGVTLVPAGDTPGEALAEAPVRL